MNGNWAVLDMTGHVGASATMASLALTAFWGMVTLGRLVFAKVPIATTRIYHVLPFVLIASFVLIAMLPVGATGMGIAAFALAGIGCSALLPLTISYAQEQLTVMTTAVAGGIIAFYQIGYGIAAFGAGALQDAGITLSTLFGWTAAVALAAGVLSFFVTSSSKPATTTPLVQGP
jgi:predicted MFS family arabinose efflux permease